MMTMGEISLLSEVRGRRKRFRVSPPAVVPTSKCQTLTGVCCPSRHASSHQCSFATRGARAPTGTNSNGRRNWGESFFPTEKLCIVRAWRSKVNVAIND